MVVVPRASDEKAHELTDAQAGGLGFFLPALHAPARNVERDGQRRVQLFGYVHRGLHNFAPQLRFPLAGGRTGEGGGGGEERLERLGSGHGPVNDGGGGLTGGRGSGGGLLGGHGVMVGAPLTDQTRREKAALPDSHNACRDPSTTWVSLVR